MKLPLGREIIKDIIKNTEIAKEEYIPICQDTGFAVFFLKLDRMSRL